MGYTGYYYYYQSKQQFERELDGLMGALLPSSAKKGSRTADRRKKCAAVVHIETAVVDANPDRSSAYVCRCWGRRW